MIVCKIEYDSNDRIIRPDDALVERKARESERAPYSFDPGYLHVESEVNFFSNLDNEKMAQMYLRSHASKFKKEHPGFRVVATAVQPEVSLNPTYQVGYRAILLYAVEDPSTMPVHLRNRALRSRLSYVDGI